MSRLMMIEARAMRVRLGCEVTLRYHDSINTQHDYLMFLSAR
jgi:hypothetical protein